MNSITADHNNNDAKQIMQKQITMRKQQIQHTQKNKHRKIARSHRYSEPPLPHPEHTQKHDKQTQSETKTNTNGKTYALEFANMARSKDNQHKQIKQ